MNLKGNVPLLLAVFGFVAGLAVGPAWFWIRADGMVSEAVVARRLAALQKDQQQRSQGWNFWTVEIDELAKELKDDKARLRKQSDLLDQRQARIEAERQELEKLRAELESMRREIDERVVAITADEVKNLRGLSQTYATMPPAAAVTIIREMDDASAVKILAVMKPDVRANIFEAMATASANDPTLARRAAVLSDKLRLMKSGVQPPAQAQTAAAN